MTPQSHSPDRWWPVSRLLGLPGLPGTRQGLNKLARTRNWSRREVTGGGAKRSEIHEASLPREVVAALTQAPESSLLAEYVAPAPVKAERVEFSRLKRDHELAEAMRQAKLEVCDAYDSYLTVAQFNSALVTFDELYLQRRLSRISGRTYGLIPTVSTRTVQRWIKQAAELGAAALADGRAERRGQRSIDVSDKIGQFILGEVGKRRGVSARHVHEQLSMIYPAEAPSLSTIGRLIKEFNARFDVPLSYKNDYDRYRNVHELALGEYDVGDRPNAHWQLDGTRVDVMCADNVRYSLLVLLDTFTRRTIAVLVQNSNAATVAEVLKMGFLHWGKPKCITVDNGTELRSRHVSELCRDLAIEKIHTRPYQGREKPFVERYIGILMKRLEDVPGFIGHNVGERKKIENSVGFERARKERLKATTESRHLWHYQTRLTRDELQLALRDICEALANAPRKKLDGKTPIQVADAYEHLVERFPYSKAEFDLVIAPHAVREFRQVDAEGIRFLNGRFWGDALLGFVGQRVRISLGMCSDGQATPDLLLVRTMKGNVVGFAKRIGLGSEFTNADAAKARHALTSRTREWAKEIEHIWADNQRLVQLAKVEREAAKVVPLPAPRRPSLVASNPVLDDQAKLLAGWEPVESYPTTDEEQRLLADAKRSQVPAPEQTNVHSIGTMEYLQEERKQRFLRGLHAQDQGDELSAEESDWMHRYSTSSAYSAEFAIWCEVDPRFARFKDLGLAAANG